MNYFVTDFIGWSSWSEWSDCTKDGIRFRHRKCLVEEPSATECRGEEFEKTACVPGECEGNFKILYFFGDQTNRSYNSFLF